jgi:hypothetical protein
LELFRLYDIFCFPSFLHITYYKQKTEDYRDTRFTNLQDFKRRSPYSEKL